MLRLTITEPRHSCKSGGKHISTPEPQLLAISPWEKKMIKEIERSLQAANLGFSISNDGNIIRVVAPPFTEERRKGLCKAD